MRGIVLLTMARSRSSMVAEIFRKHGVSFGNTYRPEDNRIGYNEHKELKKIVRDVRPDCYRDILDGKNPELAVFNFGSRWRSILEKEGFKEPWGAKVDVFCHDAFASFGPSFVGLYRNRHDIRASCQRAMRNRFADSEWDKIIIEHHKRLGELHIPIIDTDALVDGDDSSLRSAMEVCGLCYNRDIVDAVIKK